MKTLCHASVKLSFTCVLLLSGCVNIWQESLDIKTYMIEADRESASMKEPLANKLWIDAVTVLPPYNVRNLVLRQSDVEFAESYYSELLMAPSDNFRNAFYTWFSTSGIFRDVSLADRANMTHRLVVSVIAFYGDETEGRAVLRIKATLFDETTREMLPLFSNIYQQETPLEDPGNLSAEQLIRAYNRALGKILKECEQDIVNSIGQ